jgi:hypothetical protein
LWSIELDLSYIYGNAVPSVGGLGRKLAAVLIFPSVTIGECVAMYRSIRHLQSVVDTVFKIGCAVRDGGSDFLGSGHSLSAGSAG